MPVVESMAGMYAISAGIGGLGSLISSISNAWSSHKNRQSSERISALNRDSSEEVARLSRKHSAELQYNQIKFSILQQRENQDFQRELAELSHERLKEIEAFRAEVNFAINQKNLDFQKWRFEEEKKIQFEILQLQQDFQRDLVRLQHHNAVEQMREKSRSDKSPIANLSFDLLENSFAQGVMPLKLFLAPPFLDHDPSTGKPLTSGYETYLAEEIEQFLHQGYLGSPHHPVQLVDRAWESKKWGGSSALQALHGQLKSIPVLVLESDINLGDLVNFKLGYWSAGDISYTKTTILSGQSLDDLLYSVAKNRAKEWEVTRQKLQEMGKDEAFIKEKGGLNEENLQILQEELAEKAEFEQHGLDLTVKKDYKLSNLDYRAFYQYLAVWHCLAIGLYADILFLGNSWDNTPLLPSFIPYLLEKYQSNPLLTPDFWQEAISKIVKCYGDFYDSLTVDSAYCAPDVRMKLALSLANLPREYGYLALEQGNKAFSDWLDVNNVPSDKVFDVENDEDCQVLKRIIYQEDKPFLESLKLLLGKVRDADKIEASQTEGINSLLLGWQFLSRFGNIPQLPAMEAIDLPMIVDEKVKPNMPNPSENFTEMLPGEVALEMISIPAGEFMMGSDGYDDLKHDFHLEHIPDHDAASPMHKVKVQSFCMGKSPITQAQYEAVMGNNPSAETYNNAYPVNGVNWNMAQEFCQKLSELTGKNYQLPTESQWEYACRAGTTTKYFFGEKCQYIQKYATIRYHRHLFFLDKRKNGFVESFIFNYHNSPGIGIRLVMSFKPNPWGLYDLLGNVWEWCEDDWIDGYYGHPSDGSAVITGSNQKAVRGGCFNSSQNDCCSFSRSFRDSNIADNTIGFRVVCVP
ncbi:MAG: formylglycine-generating enzyme family protein [Snowella sp.]|nr:formylglycine-generating enzyme family protein [Snowella sp.]